MYYTSVLCITLGLILACQCQQYQTASDNDHQYVPRTPPPQILTHKQALNHDGNFKYLFTSENGLAQGESIAPDGSRNGGYSYIDPNGKKISVKYTAGKEGFRILEADHLPKAPQPVAPLPAAQTNQVSYAPQQRNTVAYTQPQTREEDGRYRSEVYERPYQPQHVTAYPVSSYPKPYQQQPIARAPSNQISTEEKEPEYNDEPGKAHSFGAGYIFEFSG